MSRRSQRFCPICGFLLLGDHDVCLQCGTRLKGGEFDPARDVPPPQDSPHGVISTRSWFGTALLMLVPGVNLVALILWACGKCKRIQRRNFARGVLLALAVLLVASMLIFSTLTLIVLRHGGDPAAYFSAFPVVNWFT